MWSVLQAWQLAFLCEFNLLISSVLGLTATVIALFRGIGVVAFGVGAFVTGTSAAVLLIFVVALQWRRRKLPLPMIKLRGSCELFRYSSPVIVSRIALSLVNNGQSVIVSACLNPTAAAILSLTSRIFTGCRTLLEPIIGSSFAGIAHLVGESASHSGRVRAVLQELFTIIASSAALMLGMAAALNVSFGRLWVGPERFGGVALTIVICMATLAVFINNIQGTILTALGNIRGPAWCSLLEVGIRVPLTIVLLLCLGIIGAPLAAVWYVACNWVVVSLPVTPSRPVAWKGRSSQDRGRWIAGAHCLSICLCCGRSLVVACDDLVRLNKSRRPDGSCTGNAGGCVDAIRTTAKLAK